MEKEYYIYCCEGMDDGIYKFTVQGEVPNHSNWFYIYFAGRGLYYYDNDIMILVTKNGSVPNFPDGGWTDVLIPDHDKGGNWTEGPFRKRSSVIYWTTDTPVPGFIQEEIDSGKVKYVTSDSE